MKGAAKLHRQQFINYLGDTGRSLTLRMPAERAASTTAVDKVLGQRAKAERADTAYGESITVTGIVSGFSGVDAMYGRVPATIAALGRTEQLDLLVRCLIDDTLVDPQKPLGRTVFHTAKDVLYNGEAFEVMGVDRSGLPPLDPYVLWVGLKKIGEK